MGGTSDKRIFSIAHQTQTFPLPVEKIYFVYFINIYIICIYIIYGLRLYFSRCGCDCAGIVTDGECRALSLWW